MSSGSKVITGIAGLIFGIIILAIIIPMQNQQQQAIQTGLQQTNSQLNDATLDLINVCMTTQSIVDLNGCKQDLTDLQNRCKDPQNSIPACNDPRIDQFFSTVDSKIAHGQTQISTATLKVIDVCSRIHAPVEQCKFIMLEVQADCENQYTPACDDPRITQILNRQPNTVKTLNPDGDIASQSNQIVSDFLDRCMQATQPEDMQSCADTAKKMINLCNSMPGGIPAGCSDLRLQQIANNGQIANPITPSSTSVQTVFSPCPSVQIMVPSDCLGKYLPSSSDIGSDWISQDGPSIPAAANPSPMITQYVHQDYENAHANPEEVFDVWIEEWQSDSAAQIAFKTDEKSDYTQKSIVKNPQSNDDIIFSWSQPPQNGLTSSGAEFVLGSTIVKVEGIGDGDTSFQDMKKITQLILNKIGNSNISTTENNNFPKTTSSQSTSPPSKQSSLQFTNGFLKMDKLQYSANATPSEFATVSGKVNNSNGGYVILTITYPDGEKDQINAYVTNVGIFSSLIILDKTFPAGTYIVSGKYNDLELGSVSFTVK